MPIIEEQKIERAEFSSPLQKFLEKSNGEEYILMIKGTLEEYFQLDEEKADYLDEGIIILNSPASIKHESIFIDLITKMYEFAKKNNLGKVLGSKATIQLGNNRFEPDILFISKENPGTFNDYEFIGVPDLVIEIISKTSRNIDLSKKRAVYQEYKVREIWFIDYLKNEIFVDSLLGASYQTNMYKYGEKISSKVIKEFNILLD